MRIFQLVSILHFGDAIGNDVVAFDRALREAGYETGIFATQIDKKMEGEGRKLIEDMPELNEEDIMIYHMAHGYKTSYIFRDLKCRKVMAYHNITPPEFFKKYDEGSANVSRSGYEELRFLAECTDYCLAVSEFNKQNLIENGFKCKIDVLPIIMPFEDYEKKPAENIMEKYGNDDVTNILFVGRVVPNKKLEDVVSAFDAYRKLYNKNSRLIFVGSSNDRNPYKTRLDAYIDMLGDENIIFPGHIGFDEIIAFYKTADIFLCQSEHEGFCVPLVEAMKFDVPIIAYDAAAIGDTLGGAGILLKEKDPLITAGMIDRLVKDRELRENVIENQRERLNDFSYEKVSKRLIELIEAFK